MDPRDYFRWLLEQHQTNPSRLAVELKRLGRTDTNIQPSLSRWLSDPNLEPKLSTMRPVADFFGVDVRAFYDAKAADQAAGKQTALPPAAVGKNDTVFSDNVKTANGRNTADERRLFAEVTQAELHWLDALRRAPQGVRDAVLQQLQAETPEQEAKRAVERAQKAANIKKKNERGIDPGEVRRNAGPRGNH